MFHLSFRKQRGLSPKSQLPAKNVTFLCRTFEHLAESSCDFLELLAASQLQSQGFPPTTDFENGQTLIHLDKTLVFFSVT